MSLKTACATYILCIKLASTTQQDPISKKQQQIPPPQNQLNNYLTTRHRACCSVVECTVHHKTKTPTNQKQKTQDALCLTGLILKSHFKYLVSRHSMSRVVEQQKTLQFVRFFNDLVQ